MLSIIESRKYPKLCIIVLIYTYCLFSNLYFALSLCIAISIGNCVVVCVECQFSHFFGDITKIFVCFILKYKFFGYYESAHCLPIKQVPKFIRKTVISVILCLCFMISDSGWFFSYDKKVTYFLRFIRFHYTIFVFIFPTNNERGCLRTH